MSAPVGDGASERYLRFGIGPARLIDRRDPDGVVTYLAHSDYTGGRTVGCLTDGVPPTRLRTVVAGALADWAPQAPDDLTLPASSADALADLFAAQPDRWSWWWRDAAAPETTKAGPDATVPLADTVLLDAADPRIDALLAHSTSAYIRSGDPRVERWAGVIEGSELIACAAMMAGGLGARHIVSVCVAPDHRRRGFAAAVTDRLVAEANGLGAPGVCLEMYSDNAPARALYARLGFSEELLLASGRIHRA